MPLALHAGTRQKQKKLPGCIEFYPLSDYSTYFTVASLRRLDRHGVEDLDDGRLSARQLYVLEMSVEPGSPDRNKGSSIVKISKRMKQKNRSESRDQNRR